MVRFLPLLTRKLCRDLWAHKLSLVALIAIVAVGISTYTSMSAVAIDLDQARQRYYDRQQLADFGVNLKRAPNSSLAWVAALPNIKRVRGRVRQDVLVSLPGRSVPMPGVALSMPGRRVAVIDDILLRTGGWFSSSDAPELILNHDFARAHGLEPGHRLRVTLLDKQHDLLIVGTAQSPEYVYMFSPSSGLVPDPAGYGVMYLPRRFLEESSGLAGAYNELVGLAHDGRRQALVETLAMLERKLDAYGVTQTTPVQDLPSNRMLTDELISLALTAKLFPMLFVGVAALVMNILLGRLVVQQRTVIGTFKALGYSSLAITRHYLGFGLLVGGVGGLCGLALGGLLQVAMLGIYRQFFAIPQIQAQLHPTNLLIGMGIAIGFALLGTIKGIRYAARLAPAEAMRPPPPEQGGRVLPERAPFVWRRLSFRWRMVLRAMFRNPLRSMVSMLAATIATALLVSTFSMYDALDYLMEYTFKRMAHQDYTVGLREPVGERSLSEMQRLPGVTVAEPQLDVVCDLRHGRWVKRIGVTGLPPHNRLHTPLDGEGKPLVIPAQGIVLTRKLAEILHVRVGDEISLRPLIGRRERVTAPVVGVVETFIGVSAYCDIRYLSRLLGEQWVANTLLSQTSPGRPDPLMNELESRPSVIGITRRMRAYEQLQATMGEIQGTMLGVMIGFAGLIAFGSVLNMALVSLSERQREVGTLRVLGYTPGQITGIFTGEAYLLNLVGIAAGVAGGIWLTTVMSQFYDTEMYRFPVVIKAQNLIGCALLMLFFVSLVQFFIRRMIGRLPWLEVLKVKE